MYLLFHLYFRLVRLISDITELVVIQVCMWFATHTGFAVCYGSVARSNPCEANHRQPNLLDLRCVIYDTT